MSESFIEPLSRFTPDAGRLDRAALLLSVGRACARPNRGWVALTTALAISQALTLVLLWPRPVPSVAIVPPPSSTLEAPAPEPYDDPGDSLRLWTAQQKLLKSVLEGQPVPAETGTFIENGPPLRAFAPPPSLLN
jgi:hypothetical protein